jgi:uncharacterized protein (DUF1778 family)
MPDDASTRKERPVSLRLRVADLGLIDRAATLRGRSRTEFMRDAAVREAEDILLRSAIIQQDRDAFAHFVSAIDAPPRPVPELVELFGARPPWKAGTAKARARARKRARS